MVLSLMRKHAKSWLIKVLIGIIAAVFIFYFGYSFTSKRALKMALVNGEVISSLEYQKTYRDLLEGLRVRYKGLWNDNLIKVFDLKNKALENLINQKLISQEAKKLGLAVTESEVQKAIMDYPAFQTNGQFDLRRYKALLGNNRMKPEDFEATMDGELLRGKLSQFLLAFMGVTDQEVLDYYTYTNEKIKISFVQFKPEKLKKSTKLDQAAMEEYFKEHKEGYRVPEKIKLAYLLIDPANFRDKVVVTDLEIGEYYEYNMATFTEPKQVRARHILFKLGDDATDAQDKETRKKADAVLEEARQGKDFAALARTHSEGPTKGKGGDLGYFKAGQMVKPFEEAVFKMKKGEISDLVRTRFGYHIIKVEDIKEARTKPLEEVRGQIVETLTKSSSTDLAHEKGMSLIDQMPYDVDLGQYAAQHDVKVAHTDYFSQDNPIPGVGGNDEKLRQSLFSLDKRETSELIELKGQFYIFQVADKKASYLPEMSEVADKVKEDFAAYFATQQAKATAEGYLAELQKGEAWNKLAKDKGLKPEKTDFFMRRDRIPKIGQEPDLTEMVFGLTENKRYPDKIFSNDKGAYVIRWEAREGIDEKKYQEEKEKYRFTLMQTKHRRAFEKWLESLRKNAEIEIVTPVT
jgi:peptidyl-prolyl cis-trans isomerase D